MSDETVVEPVEAEVPVEVVVESHPSPPPVVEALTGVTCDCGWCNRFGPGRG